MKKILLFLLIVMLMIMSTLASTNRIPIYNPFWSSHMQYIATGLDNDLTKDIIWDNTGTTTPLNNSINTTETSLYLKDNLTSLDFPLSGILIIGDEAIVYANFTVSSNLSSDNTTLVSTTRRGAYGSTAASHSADVDVYFTRYEIGVNETSDPYFTINTDGNSGFGTIAPDEKLHVVGNSFLTGTFTQNTSLVNTSVIDIFQSPASNNVANIVKIEANGTNWGAGSSLLKLIADDNDVYLLLGNNGASTTSYLTRSGLLYLSSNILLGSGGSLTTSSNGNITMLPNGNGITQIGDASSTTHSLTDNDDLFVSGKFEVDGNIFFDGTPYFAAGLIMNDGQSIVLGGGMDTYFQYSTTQTPDSLLLGLSADSNEFIITEKADVATDFGRPLKTNPTLNIQSANSSDTDEFISLEHDQTDARVVSGQGDLRLSAAEDIRIDSDFVMGDDTNYLLFEEYSNGTDMLFKGGSSALDFNIIPYTGAITQIGDAGSTSHSLVANDDLFVSGKLEVDGASNFDSTVTHYANVFIVDDKDIMLGSSSDTRLRYSTIQTPANLYLGLSTESNGLIIGEITDVGTDFAHPLQTDPTLFIQANNGTGNWTGITHNTTYGIISTGAGDIYLNPAGDNVRLPDDTNVTWDNGAMIGVNATCLILTSPDGSGVVNVCDT